MICGVQFAEFLVECQLLFWQDLMYWLTQVAPHPVTTTPVQGDISKSCKVMLCTLPLNVNGGSTRNFKLCLGSFRSMKISRHYLNRRYFTHIFWLEICKCFCVFFYIYVLYTYSGQEKGIQIWRNALNYSSFCVLVTVKVYCVWKLTCTMCVGLWHISRKVLLNSQNMKSIGLSIKPKDGKAEH